jgi:ribosomal protein S27E
MTEMILVKSEVNCKNCDKPSMEPMGKPKAFKFDSGEIFKTLVKCHICGRISYILRPTQ